MSLSLHSTTLRHHSILHFISRFHSFIIYHFLLLFYFTHSSFCLTNSSHFHLTIFHFLSSYKRTSLARRFPICPGKLWRRRTRAQCGTKLGAQGSAASRRDRGVSPPVGRGLPSPPLPGGRQPRIYARAGVGSTTRSH